MPRINEGDRVEVLHIAGEDQPGSLIPAGRFGVVQWIRGTAYVKASIVLDDGRVIVVDCPPSRIERVWRRTMLGGWE